MCEKCEHAKADLQELRVRLRDAMKPKHQSELRSRIRRAESDLGRLRWYEHGGDRPAAGGERERKAEGLGQLNAFG